ncbi:B3 domain-containing protein Os01g0723500 isoform X1 [Amborella trichopoda]|uniref:B3 domain-containing protein Os01g0723500 isoform X1 n=2 Tax=Amborella trichopoda TaxID=13333 RepID=UPI0009BE7B47|nr:B3 domain-containing protein Os01g0723500 isoform X1 [Amborella trichopoda]|eukprot:XP_020520745.1 B3 domain-containing protein Os01g0723500 isoform X1 [Amborella trichopoda]
MLVDRGGGNGSRGSERDFYYFFKVLLGNFSEQLVKSSIPPAFRTYLEHEVSRKVFLKGPSGDVWPVDLKKTVGGMLFQNGWKDFVNDHCLQLGHFLVFRYDGDVYFTVQIFDQTCCEKEDAFLVHNSDEMDFNEDNAEEVKVKENLMKQSRIARNRSFKSKMNRTNGKVNIFPTQPVFDNGYVEAEKNDMKTKMNDIMTVGDSSDESSCEEQCSEKQRRISRALEPSQKKDTHNSTSDRRISRERTVVSARRRVTKREMHNAIDSASSFQSSKPSFTLVMKPGNVYRHFTAFVPAAFAREHLPCCQCKLILRNQAGCSWTVSYSPHGMKGYRMHGGWKQFSFENNLEDGDACAFELVKGKKEFIVHIFRVIQEIKPLRWISSAAKTKR